MALIDDIGAAIGGLTTIGAVGGLLFNSGGYAIGWVPIDLFEKSEHKSDTTATKYPVEIGAMYSDNIVIEPIRVTISGVISDTRTGEPFDMALAGAVGSLAQGIIGGFPIAKGSASWQMLRMMQTMRVTFTLSAGLEIYPNMFLQSLTGVKEPGKCNKLRFTAVCQEILTAELENRQMRSDIDATPTTGDGASANTSSINTADKAAPPVHKGIQKPNQSFLYQWGMR
jgi:hypothetical protein